jgi:hypothetical protein
MFDLKRPCKDCPFRKGVGETFQLSVGRLREIKRGDAFQCHKTVDYSEWIDVHKRQGDRPQQCAGLMAVLARENAANTIMQVAERFGRLDLDTLDPLGEAYASWAAVLDAHNPRRSR